MDDKELIDIGNRVCAWLAEEVLHPTVDDVTAVCMTVMSFMYMQIENNAGREIAQQRLQTLVQFHQDENVRGVFLPDFTAPESEVKH